MCGIVAQHGGSDHDGLERMLERLTHRGPDDAGTVAVDGRDPVGIKPLYWTPPEHDGDPVRFASEMHAFEAEWQARVEPFPPGCAWTPQDGLVRFAHAIPARAKAPPQDPVAGTREVVIDAVRRQMTTSQSASSSRAGWTRASSRRSPRRTCASTAASCRRSRSARRSRRI